MLNAMAVVLNESLGLRYHLVDCSLNLPQSTALPYIPCFQGLHNMASFQMPPQEIPMLDLYNDDPVSKALFNNFVGNLPIAEHKKKIPFTCHVCGLEFMSKIVLETHVAGSKHQRKLKAKDLMQNLERNESGFEKDSVSGVIRCTVCDVTVNSPQLLATHIAGNKHRLRKRKREEEGSSVSKKSCPNSGDTENTNDSTTSNGQPSDDVTTHAPTKKKEKKERQALQIEIPDYVDKLDESKGGGKFLCNPCQAHCNSDNQLSQHLSSKKHLDKVNGRKKPPFSEFARSNHPYRGRHPRGRDNFLWQTHPYGQELFNVEGYDGTLQQMVDFERRGRGCGRRPIARSAPYFNQYNGRYLYGNGEAFTYTQPLSHNFVSGGSFANET